MNVLSEFFGETIFTYTRSQAITDGVLVDVSKTAREAGFRCPVAMTQAAWEDNVAWSESDSQRQGPQDLDGRLWDVLTMAQGAIRSASGHEQQLIYRFLRIPRDGVTKTPSLTTLKLVTGPGDAGEQVITIMLVHED
ncbi:MAG: hypothetical protein GY807_14450 [Gammaproteobacteria bacterium]|nr:hypothetical protein [Gammaproteobacteria bacterium]